MKAQTKQKCEQRRIVSSATGFNYRFRVHLFVAVEFQTNAATLLSPGRKQPCREPGPAPFKQVRGDTRIVSSLKLQMFAFVISRVWTLCCAFVVTVMKYDNSLLCNVDDRHSEICDSY